MGEFSTGQEAFWAGTFGKEYIARNTLTPQHRAGTSALWANILRRMAVPPTSVLELGSNIGNNLRVLHDLLPEASLSAVEINPVAAEHVRQWGLAEVIESSILTFVPARQWDFVFTSGVLIHINPHMLPTVYKLMYTATSRYICVSEYYSPKPEEVPYRGHNEKMYRRDFAGELLDAFPDLRLRGYAFAYHRDPLFPMGDMTWFLLEKTS